MSQISNGHKNGHRAHKAHNRKKSNDHKKNRKHGKIDKMDKMKFKLSKMISKTEFLKEKKNEELDLLNIQQKQLQKLLDEADKLDINTLQNEIKNVLKAYKIKKNKRFRKKGNKNFNKKWNKKQEKNERKNHQKWDKKNNKKDRKNKRDKKWNKKQEKNEKKSNKEENKKFKEEQKAERQRKKQQRKLEKEERKRIKREKLEKLDAARLSSLPSNKNEIGNNNLLNIYVDGYNIIGCDAECRKNMRGRNGGMKKSRLRLTNLLQQKFLNKKNNLNLPYDIKLYLWFDGNGKNEKNGDIQITFSTKKQIVDDKLVEQFSKNKFEQNSNILVVTTDKELTLRLYQIGVKVIKSSTFYKTYLKDNNNDNNNNKVNKMNNNDNDNNNDDEKYQTEYQTPYGVPGEAEDAVFIKYCTQKMTSNTTSDEEEGADGEDTHDEMETDDEEYSFCNDEDDDEFDETFGGDSDDIDNIE